jgi:molybdopterin converting factor small subunit
MMIRVKMFGRFGSELWECREIGAKNGASALEVLKAAVPRDSGMFPAIFDAEERIKNHIIVVRNGTRMTTAEYDGLPLKDSDEIAVLPPVAGG